MQYMMWVVLWWWLKWELRDCDGWFFGGNLYMACLLLTYHYMSNYDIIKYTLYT